MQFTKTIAMAIAITGVVATPWGSPTPTPTPTPNPPATCSANQVQSCCDTSSTASSTNDISGILNSLTASIPIIGPILVSLGLGLAGVLEDNSINAACILDSLLNGQTCTAQQICCTNTGNNVQQTCTESDGQTIDLTLLNNISILSGLTIPIL